MVAENEGRQVRYELAADSLARALADVADVVRGIEIGEPCLNDRSPTMSLGA